MTYKIYSLYSHFDLLYFYLIFIYLFLYFYRMIKHKHNLFDRFVNYHTHKQIISSWSRCSRTHSLQQIAGRTLTPYHRHLSSLSFSISWSTLPPSSIDSSNPPNSPPPSHESSSLAKECLQTSKDWMHLKFLFRFLLLCGSPDFDSSWYR